MRILDRTIVARFLWNFTVLFVLLFVFAASIDVILQLEKYLRVAAANVELGRYPNKAVAFAGMIVEFHGPRVFQFFQFMVGLLAVGAMGFTFSQMHRTRELVAIMAAGVPLRRCTWAVLAAALALNVVAVLNQELLLPRFADRLMLDHLDLGRADRGSFPVTLTRDGSGNLLYASKFDPESGRITGFLGLERDEGGVVRPDDGARGNGRRKPRRACGNRLFRRPRRRRGCLRSGLRRARRRGCAERGGRLRAGSGGEHGQCAGGDGDVGVDFDGVGAALQQMRERLVIADLHADPAGIACGGGKECRLEMRVARSEQRQPSAERDDFVEALRQDVHALLPRQAADDGKQGAIPRFQSEYALDRTLVRLPPAQRAGRVAAG
jgi:hypothetical protein